jgi:hypothetical protein
VVIDKYSMDKLDIIAKDLFDKIRGRYQNVTLGNQESTITNEPGQARFFDVKITNGQNVNLALDEKSLTIMYSQKLFDEDQIGKDNWYSFLKELRMFAKKRMLNFDIRDITKSNLDRRDYEYLRKEKFGDTTMSESKLYGTSKKSFQDIGSSKLIITHTESMNYETNRSTKIKSIHIENADGERFKYPYKHLSGARAIARHVSEGGNLYDDFGKHVVGLSEELSKLRKFKTYMNRSAVMAEGLGGYADAVNERLDTIKTTIHKLQKESFYREYYEAFSPEDDVVVPEDIQGDWIEQLTVKQFNEELKDVFPYIYKLVSENSKTKELSLEDLTDATKGENMNPDFDKMFDESLGNFAEHKTEKKDYIDFVIENVTTLEQFNNMSHTKLWKAYTSSLSESQLAEAQLNESGLSFILSKTAKAGKNAIDAIGKAFGKGADDAASVAGKATDGTPSSRLDTKGQISGAPDTAKQADALADINKIAVDAAQKKADEVAPGLGKTIDKGIEMPSQSFISKVTGKAGDAASAAGKVAGDAASAAGKVAGDAAKTVAKGAGKAASAVGKSNVAAPLAATGATLGYATHLQKDMKDSISDNIGDVGKKIDELQGTIATQSDSIANKVNQAVGTVTSKADDVANQVTGGTGGLDSAMDKATDLAKSGVEAVTQSDAAKKLQDALPSFEGSTISQIAKIAAQNWLPLGLVLLTIIGGLRVIKWFFGLLFDDIDPQTTGASLQESGDAKVPVTEFILSYFDRETGSFPKGETAVLTMVEKDYGDKYVPVAEKFIEAVQHKFVEMNQSSNELNRIRELANL